jgi:hypothetical protein
MYPARNKEGEPTIVVENLKINWCQVGDYWNCSLIDPTLSSWKFDLRIIWPSNLFILKFLENYAIRVFNQITW